MGPRAEGGRAYVRGGVRSGRAAPPAGLRRHLHGSHGVRLEGARGQRRAHRRHARRAAEIHGAEHRPALRPRRADTRGDLTRVAQPTVLGVVTARAGSKGIPGKNTKLLAGKPLIAYTIQAALASGVFNRLIVSTDDDQAARIARDPGCEVPFMRPANISTDDTPHLPVMVHAAAWLADHDRYH